MSIGQPKSEGAPLLPTASSDPVVDKIEAEPTHHALLGITCVALASLCFSLMVTFIKYMTFSFSSMEATFWRSIGVLVFNYITVKVSGTSLYVPPEYRRMLLYRCLVGFTCMGFAFYAMSQMVLADASALILTSPIMTFFMANSWIGVCSALLGALSQVGVFLTVRQLKGLNVFVIVHYFALASVILTMLWLTLIQQSFLIPSTFQLWRAILGTGVFAFGGQMLLTKGFQLEKAGIAAVMRYLQVVFVFIWDSLILGEHINHWSIVGAFIIVSGAVAIAVRKIKTACIWYNGKSLYVAPEDRMMLFYRCLAGFSSISFAFYAVSQMVLADASTVVFTSPVFTFFLGACVLHERIDIPSFACALLSFGGLLCVVRPAFIFGNDHATAHTDGSWIAIGSALLGAIGQAFVFISVRKLKSIHFLVIVHYFMLFSVIGSLLYMVLVQRVFVVPSTTGVWLAVIGSGVFTFVGQMLLTKGFQLEKAGIASVMRYLDVVCVFMWDYLLLGEKINYWSVVGAAIICTCAATIALRKAHTG
ncbi:putative membrane protein [Phytophthora nicotianae]|uniref:Membrane protein n=1 Tax=Phytophthora nicotianae TaxID=4792 RepID=A0A0W8CA07_PHYNI|nr:putative membrane protein [Phytophthora nicotianae]